MYNKTREKLVTGHMSVFNAAAEGIENGNYEDARRTAEVAINAAESVISLQENLTPQIEEQLSAGLTKIFEVSSRYATNTMRSRDTTQAQAYAGISVDATNMLFRLHG